MKDVVRKFLWRGTKIYTKHIEVFESILSLEDLIQNQMMLKLVIQPLHRFLTD